MIEDQFTYIDMVHENKFLHKYGKKDKKGKFNILIEAYQNKLLYVSFSIMSCLVLINYYLLIMSFY